MFIINFNLKSLFDNFKTKTNKMYKYFLSFILGSLFLDDACSQYLYKKGTLVNIYGDSLECMIKLEPVFERNLYFRRTINSEEEYIDLGELKYMHTNDLYFQTLKVRNKSVLSQLSIPAQDSLFFYIILHHSAKGSSGNGMTTQGTNYEYVYLLKKKDDIIELTEKNFKEKLLTLFSACSLSIERLNSPQYKFEHVPNIVEEFYRCLN
jgi:hypothetical protein